MSDQPTGEWTVDENWDKEGTIAKLYCGKGESIAVIKSENPALFHAIRYLKRLHNAALAAAYRKGHDDGYAEKQETDLDTKPTGEWTESSVSDMSFGESPFKRIADAHNAELAAERANAEKAAARAELAQIALAVERKKVQALIVALKRMQGAAMDELPAEVQRIGDEALAKTK